MLRMRIIALLACALVWFYGCQPAHKGPQVGTAEQEEAKVNDGQAFEMYDIPGATEKFAQKRDSAQQILEDGTTNAKGLKHGMWVSYDPETGNPIKIANFLNGKYNGPYFELEPSGRLTLKAHYINNELDGYVAKYNYGRLLRECYYRAGKLEGEFKEYNLTQGYLQKVIHYKNGVLDGPYQFLDEKGKVTVEYLYRDGVQQ
jgi:antitoxin component YwqK of YwqJK toxin-antitoxin module